MKITTKKGYGFFEATSAFQKAIRRNDEAMALYLMTEFFTSGYEEYVWKRIKIICSEDVGLAAPTMPATIQALYQSYQDLKKDYKENRPERLFLTHAVILLCRCKKSRLVDYATIKCYRGHDGTHMPLPDYAYDMHNVRGKQMGRGIDHFYNEGTHLENHVKMEGEQKYKDEAYQLTKKSPGKMKFETFKKGTLSQQNLIFDQEEQEQ